MVYGWREGAKWGFFAPLYSLAGPQNRTYFDLSDCSSGNSVSENPVYWKLVHGDSACYVQDYPYI